MEEKNKHLTEKIKQYLGNESDYAILIDGEWGIGKTYFLKKEGYQCIRDCKFEPRYISLNGISSLEELEKSISSKLNPLENEKSNFSKMVDNLEKIINRDAESTPFAHCQKIVLCLDDLERIKIDILEEALGYINHFIEHEHIKTIFICDESKLSEKESKYNKIKEKYIRYTFHFEPIIETILKEKCNYFPLYKDRILDVFQRSKTNNIRILLFSLEVLNKVFKSDKNLDDNLKSKLVLFCLFYSIEIKKGISKVILDGQKYISRRDPNKNEISEDDKLHFAYFSDGKYDFIFFESIATLICDGHLDEKRLKEEVNSKITKNAQKNENLIVAKLSNPYQLKNNEIIPYIQDVLKEVEKGAFSIRAYLRIYNLLVWLETFQLEGLKIDAEFLTVFKTGIEKTIKNGNMIESDNISIRQYYPTDGDPVLEKTNILAKFAEQQLELASQTENALQIENIIASIKNAGDNRLFNQLKNDKDFLFSQSDAKPIFDELLSANPNTVDSFYEGMNNRYVNDGSMISDMPRKEKEFILELYQLLNGYDFTKPKPLHIIPLQLLKSSMNKLIEYHKLKKA